MAGDWIPMRTTLHDDPTVIFIARATKLPCDHVVGKLHRLWAWADSNTTDGDLLDITEDWIDNYVGKRGFAAAMASAKQPWLEINGSSLRIPHFENWFGASSKRRMADQKRKQLVRSKADICPQSNGHLSENVRTKSGPQNRTEQKSIIAPALADVDLIWIHEKARSITAKIGDCRTDRNRRLIFASCAIVRGGIPVEWLDNAVKATREGHPEKPFAYLQTVLQSTGEALGFDLRGSLDAFDLKSVAKRPNSLLQTQTC